ncbi:MAG: type II toxin-antitoxin system Phd/YefM family antitoxin [Lachnospiraceae bacterium]
MIATKQMDIRANLKKYFDLAFNGETIIVSRKENKNVVVISETEYNNLLKAKKNAEYLAKLNRAEEQIKNGQVITKTMDELLAMEE